MPRTESSLPQLHGLRPLKWRRLRLRPIHGLLLAFVLLAGCYSLVTPLLEAPDEPAHVDYMLYLARGHGLPIQSFDHDSVVVVQGHHPPLYYALGALLTFWIDTSDQAEVSRPNPNARYKLHGTGQEPNMMLHTAAEDFPWHGFVLAVRLFRLLSILFGLVTVWGAYRLGLIVTGLEPVALGAAALVAFNPQFLFLSGVANNDNAIAAFLTLALVVLATMLVDGATTRRAAWLGLWLGLAMLSKPTALAWAIPVIYVLGVLWWRQRSWRDVARLAGAIAGPVLVLSGWWFARNQLLYGDPLGYRMFLSSVSILFTPADYSLRQTWWEFLLITHRTFWGHFGWLAVQLAPRWLFFFACLYVLAPVGAAIGYLWRREAGTWTGVRNASAWGLLFLTVLVTVAWTLNFGRTNGASAFQGRYLFVAFAAIAVLLVTGISAVAPDRWRGAAVALLIAPVALLAVYVPGGYIVPTYRSVTVPESAVSGGPGRPPIAAAGRMVSDQAVVWPPSVVAADLSWARRLPNSVPRVRQRCQADGVGECGAAHGE